jgi:translation initiation factor eIF-2B subunit beta
MFSIISHPTMRQSGGQDSPSQRSGTATPQMGASGLLSNLRPEVIKGIKEIIDEINGADDEISAAALEQIHPQETIFTYSSSLSVQRFLLKAASKRKFTVIHAEAYPNNHQNTHALLTGSKELAAEDDDMLPNESFSKPLTSAGITVVMIPDSAIFAVMSRVTKVILDAHAVLTNGSLIAAAGTKAVIKAARFHRVPVLVLAATHKLSPAYPYDPVEMIEYGDASKVVPFQDAELRAGLESGVRNPLYDFVEAGDVDLFVTNQVPAVVSTGYLYRVVREQYRDEDLHL